MTNPDIPTWSRAGGLFLLAVSVSMFIVIQPFWKPVFWAVVFTIMFWPLRSRWADWMRGGATTAAVAIVLVILFFILIPAIVIIGLIADGAAAIVLSVQSGTLRPDALIDTVEQRFPALDDRLEYLGVELDEIQAQIRNGLIHAGQFAMSQMVSIGQGASVLGFQLFIFLYLAFAFLRFGDTIYASVFRVVPLKEAHKQLFFDSFANMSAATIKGTVIVGLVQGALGAAAFWVLDIPGPIFWGAMMALLSVIPPFGAGFIWAPVGIYLALTGAYVGGLGLLAYGAIIISMSDNFVRPYVVGKATSMPDYLVLLSTLGGLVSFGLTGLVVGPVVAALFLAAWKVNAADNEIAKEAPAPER